jgi:hypothetical protein
LLEILNSLGMPESGYVLSAGICAAAAAWRSQQQGAHRAAETGVWLALAASLLLLLLLKEWDVHSALTNEGRELARERGWYAQRREQLLQIVYAVLTAGVAAVFLAIVLLGRLRARLALTVLSMGALVCFIAVRTLSLHQIDALLYRRFVHGVQINLALESALACAVGLAAVLTLLASSLQFAVSLPRARRFEGSDPGLATTGKGP